eukprot:COSAG04_NODE_1770_length_5624_cov_3.175204_2_plen_79_part_00
MQHRRRLLHQVWTNCARWGVVSAPLAPHQRAGAFALGPGCALPHRRRCPPPPPPAVTVLLSAPGALPAAAGPDGEEEG